MRVNLPILIIGLVLVVLLSIVSHVIDPNIVTQSKLFAIGAAVIVGSSVALSHIFGNKDVFGNPVRNR
jgi:hypothetical protein